MKQFNIQYNIGNVKYCVNFHDGFQTFANGSPFWDIRTFRSKMKMVQFIKELKEQGYIEEATRKQYNHMVDVAFTVITTNKEPTVDEMIKGMSKRLEYLKNNRSEAIEAFGICDTFEIDNL